MFVTSLSDLSGHVYLWNYFVEVLLVIVGVVVMCLSQALLIRPSGNGYLTREPNFQQADQSRYRVTHGVVMF